MCGFFDDFIDDGDFDGDDSCEDHYDDGMEDSADPNPEDGKSDELSWDEAYWIGTGIGWAYEEGKQKKRRRKNTDPNDPSNID